MSYSDTKSWRQMIEHERAAHKDGPIIASTLSDAESDLMFHVGYGGENGKPFTAWSERRVYFPCCYDGSEWVGSAPRNPCDEPTAHQGG